MKEFHRGRMAQRVRGDVPALQRGDALLGGGDVFVDEAFDCIATQRPTPGAREHRVPWVNSGLFTQPGIEHTGHIAAERSAARFAPLAAATNVRCGAYHHVLASQGNQFGHAEPSLDGEKQERAVSPTNPTAGVGSGKKRLGLLTRKEFHWTPLESLARNGEDPLTEQGMRRLRQRDVLEKAVNGGQARIAGTSTVLAFFFKVFEELRHESCVDILDGEAGRRLVKAHRREAQQEPEGVAVGGDGVGARLPLTDEAIDEEALKQRLKSHHRSSGHDF
jgi:hypothetical protein